MIRRHVLVLLIAASACTPRRAGGDTTGQPDASTMTRPAPPEPSKPGPSLEVPGLDALAHQPLVVLIERNPWLNVIGSDVPTLALYEDGLVIYHRVKDHHAEALQAQLGKGGAQAMATELVGLGFFELPLYASVAHATDQPTVDVYLRSGTRWHLASVYGIGRDGKATHGDGEPAPAFARAYQRLATFEAPGAVPWKPEQIEVMLWGFEYAKEAKPWPATIPRPPASVKPSKNGVYKHFLDGKYDAAVHAFQATLPGTTAVELNGSKWSFGYRRRIPEEDYLWKVRQALYAERR
jgi:hypothetical protein